MSPLNLTKVKAMQRSGAICIGALYKRTRGGQVRAEVRFDDVVGCLRTPSGGSSRQTLLMVQGTTVRSRLLSPRELARLMGLPDSYELPGNYNAAYHLAGDGLAVPVVKHLADHLLTPIAMANLQTRLAFAA
jgi:DNA (cytosine-5)-methyltransferase 1